MIVCVIGAGQARHALCKALARTAEVIATPGNAGISGRSPEGHQITSVELVPEEIEADLYVIGPEVPLVEGLADRLRAMGRLVFGPSAKGARLEGSKAYMKQLAQSAGVPTASFAVFEQADEALDHLRESPGPYVIKTDGLASGKGVLVTEDLSLAEADVRAKLSGTSFGAAGRRVVIEEALSGEEFSFFALCDGKRALELPSAQDYKRLLDNDLGPNTGGMGAYSPVNFLGDKTALQVMDTIITPTLDALSDKGTEYRGVLYAGCMLTPDGPKLIEFNVRFGDPEAEVILPRISGDVAALLSSAAAGDLPDSLELSDLASVCVVIASAGYPENPVSGDRISGLDAAGTLEEVTVLHAATARDTSGNIITAGGRVLCVQAVGDSLSEARERAYRGVEAISFPGMHYRTDIARLERAEEELHR